MPTLSSIARRPEAGPAATAKYRQRLPQLHAPLFMTDGGLETTLVYREKIELPDFAAFDLLKDEAGTGTLRCYFARYTQLARAAGLGVVLESPTWRANRDWGARLGYDARMLEDANRRAIGLLLEIRSAHESPDTRVVVSGNIGPRGDGYTVDQRMSVPEAANYHAAQIETFAGTDADMVAAFTMNYVEEAIGIAQAAQAHRMPVVLSFTVETDGRLPSGDSLATAIQEADEATGGYPSYYMLNCAHPTHFASALEGGGDWLGRIRGVRANASRRSHAELDRSTDVDAGDALELGADYRGLRARLPNLVVAGGCCGTDHRHVAAICAALAD